MTSAFILGLLYFLAVSAFAFATGVSRALVIAPLLGSTAAVLLEVPILVLVSWFVAVRLLRDQSLTLLERAAMGATALCLTLASEATLATIMRGQSLGEWVVAVVTPLGLIGLGAQIAFALMPIFIGDGRAES